MLNIGIILGSTRDGRVCPQVGDWLKEVAQHRGDANYEVIDIKDYKICVFLANQEVKNQPKNGLKK